MRRGDFYRVKHPSVLDPRRSRVFVVVSRQFSWNRVFKRHLCSHLHPLRRLHSQVGVGIEQGLKHESTIHCDELVSLPKSVLTDYVGCLTPEKLSELDRALAFALDLAAPRSTERAQIFLRYPGPTPATGHLYRVVRVEALNPRT